jgi:hypothetical protein
MRLLKIFTIQLFIATALMNFGKFVLLKQVDMPKHAPPVDRELRGQPAPRLRPVTRLVRRAKTNRGLDDGASVNFNKVEVQANGSIEEIVQNALKHSNASAPQIIVINQPVPVTRLDPQQQQSNYEPVFYEESYPRTMNGPVSSVEAEGLIKTLSNIEAMYNSYYKQLPQDEDIKSSDDINEEAKNVMHFYGKVRAFVKTFFENHHQLMADLKFVSARLGSIRSGMQNMVQFYGFENRFEQLKPKIAAYETRDLKFPILYSELQTYGQKYDNHVIIIASATNDLSKLSNYFEREIAEISKRQQKDDLLDAVEKFDDVLMFTIHILDLRTKLVKSIQAIKDHLSQLKEERKPVENTLLSLNDLVVKYQQEDVRAKAGNSTVSTLKNYGGRFTLSAALAFVGMLMF